jgi:hypothetical protein
LVSLPPGYSPFFLAASIAMQILHKEQATSSNLF